MRRLPPLSALRAFEAAARHNSFKLAAEELVVTPTAISHQIRSLEQHTGFALFERRTRKVVLTEAGEQLYPVLRDSFDAVADVLVRLTRCRVRSQVTISATTAFTAKWLVPRMAGFRRLHPEIELQIHASDEVQDLAGSGIDIAIRYGQGPYLGFAVTPMFADTFAPVANPILLSTSPTDWTSFPLIEFRWRRQHPDNPTWARWFAAAGLGEALATQLRFSDESHAIQAAVAGQGAALVSLALVAGEIVAGHLVRLPGPTVRGHSYHLLTKAGAPAIPAVVAAAEWLLDEARSSVLAPP